MRLSVLASIIFVLAASVLTYAAPFGAPRTSPDIEQRSLAQLLEPRSGQSQHTKKPSRSSPPPHSDHITGSASTRGTGTRSRSGSESPDRGREVFIITRPFSRSSVPGSGHGSTPPQIFTHWAVLVGSHYYELLLDHTHPNLATCGSGSLYGSQIRMNVGDAPVPSAWTSMESKGRTHFSDEEIHTAGEEVIRQMSAHDYNIILNNCQDFANKLARCLTNPQGDRRCTLV
ncbi:hypothetical protein F5887DRAFT_282753 [Amanita rubescens]|nr:hypothetical protein F5887DRAFT_282753 [Amanita rubescens]